VSKNIALKVLLYLSVLASPAGWTGWADPTEPFGFATEVIDPKKQTASRDFVLSAILISEDNRIAVINNSVVKIGDEVGGEKVRSIESNEVKLMSKNGLKTLRLIDEKMKDVDNEKK